MKVFRKAFTLAEVPEARQYGSKHELSAEAKVMPEARQYGSKQAAFTLAEVLITLGIIGVVAAMTIPTLVKNHQKRQIEVRLAQTCSILQNVVNMAKVDYGDMSSWDVTKNTIVANESSVKVVTDNYVKKYFLPYMKVSKYYGVIPIKNAGYSGYSNPNGDAFVPDTYYLWAITELPNGVTLFFAYSFNYVKDENDQYTGEVSLAIPTVYIDLNGKLPPNVYRKDLHQIYFDTARSGIYFSAVKDLSHEQLIDYCRNVGGRPASYCVELIRQNNWKFPKDYPFPW